MNMDQSESNNVVTSEQFIDKNKERVCLKEISHYDDESLEVIEDGIMESPYIGMTFNSAKEAKEYYMEYGRNKGFVIKIRSTNKTRFNVDEVTSVHLVCSREGHGKKKGGIDGIDDFNRSVSTIKCGCNAHMRILYNKDINKWRVSKFHDVHNHKFVTPVKRMRMRSNRHMPSVVKDLTEMFHRDNLPVSKVSSILDGSMVGFNPKDCYNHLRNVRHKELDIGDAQSVFNSFQLKLSEDPQFFYAIQYDENNVATNFFWVDSRSRMAYQHFGDMVTFDTTYKTNKYELPFAPFTGVNHHYQSIQFGCALLQDETEVSFLWLFDMWLKAMGGNHPKSFITDQDNAMGAAVRKVFPNTRHRLCLWHIRKKFGEKLSHVYCQGSKMKVAMDSCVHSTYSITEFESKWKAMLDEFSLNDNDWLTHLYKIRESWVPVYHRNTFYAGMNTTGRSEGANAFFDEFVSSKTNLREFVIRYDQALKKIVEKEQHEDFESEHKNRYIDEKNLILKHAATIYTRNMFNKFREQLVDSICFRSEVGETDGDFVTYLLTAKTGPHERFTVKIKNGTYEGQCECRHFEFTGILCKHFLRVLNKLDVDEIPFHFILKRWLKGVNSFRVMDASVGGDGYACSDALRLSHLYRRSAQVWYVASTSDKLYKIAMECIEEAFTRIMEKRSEMDGCVVELPVLTSNVEEDLEAEKTCQISLKDPNVAKPKGSPKEVKGRGRISSTGRIKSSIEIAMGKRKVRCSLCKSLGHTKRSCHERGKLRTEDQDSSMAK